MTTMYQLPNACPLCEDRNMRIMDVGKGRRHAEPCTCRGRKREAAVLAQAQVPERYEHCTLEPLKYAFAGAHPSLRRALSTVKRYVDEHPLGTPGNSLLFIGTIGVGKTHLATGLLRELIEPWAVGLFCDYRDLLTQVKSSYNSRSEETELQVLRPVIEAEALILDEIGASRPTE